jgi:hypothetical protein
VIEAAFASTVAFVLPSATVAGFRTGLIKGCALFAFRAASAAAAAASAFAGVGEGVGFSVGVGEGVGDAAGFGAILKTLAMRVATVAF